MRVIGVGEGEVTLEAPRASACKACAARAGCGSGALAEMLGTREVLTLPCTGTAKIGDTLDVALPVGAFLGTVARAYMLPALALAVLALAALAFQLSDTVTALLALPILALAFLPLVSAERRNRKAPAMVIAQDAQDHA